MPSDQRFSQYKDTHRPQSDAPLFGCPVARMGNDPMTAPHRPKQCAIIVQRANHRIIIHRINRAYCHPTIGFRHTKTPIGPNSDVPLSGCPDVRMENDRMTAPHRKRRCAIIVHRANHWSIMHRTNRAYCHPTIGLSPRNVHIGGPIRMPCCPVARLFGWEMLG